MLKIGTCFPTSCDSTDLEKLLSLGLLKMSDANWQTLSFLYANECLCHWLEKMKPSHRFYCMHIYKSQSTI